MLLRDKHCTARVLVFDEMMRFKLGHNAFYFELKVFFSSSYLIFVLTFLSCRKTAKWQKL